MTIKHLSLQIPRVFPGEWVIPSSIPLRLRCRKWLKLTTTGCRQTWRLAITMWWFCTLKTIANWPRNTGIIYRATSSWRIIDVWRPYCTMTRKWCRWQAVNWGVSPTDSRGVPLPLSIWPNPFVSVNGQPCPVKNVWWNLFTTLKKNGVLFQCTQCPGQRQTLKYLWGLMR